MAELKQITQNVIEKEKEALKKEFEEKQKAVDEEIESAKSNAEEQKEKEKKTIDEEMNNQFDIKKNALAVQHRNAILALKQAKIQSVLQQAKQHLNRLEKEKFQAFTESVLKVFEGSDKVQLTLGEGSKGHIDQEWLANLPIESLNVTLTEDTISDEGGFVIEKDGVNYNFLFEALVDNIKSELTPELSEQLFS